MTATYDDAVVTYDAIYTSYDGTDLTPPVPPVNNPSSMMIASYTLPGVIFTHRRDEMTHL